MKSAFLDKLINRLDRIDPGSLQTHFLRLANEKGLLETIFNAVREGLIVLDHKGKITYANRAAGKLLGFSSDAVMGDSIQRYLREIEWDRVLKLDEKEWSRLVSREIEITYPEHRFLDFYVVPLAPETPGRERRGGHSSRRHARSRARGSDDRVRAAERADASGRRRRSRDRQSAQLAEHPPSTARARNGKPAAGENGNLERTGGRIEKGSRPARPDHHPVPARHPTDPAEPREWFGLRRAPRNARVPQARNQGPRRAGRGGVPGRSSDGSARRQPDQAGVLQHHSKRHPSHAERRHAENFHVGHGPVCFDLVQGQRAWALRPKISARFSNRTTRQSPKARGSG